MNKICSGYNNEARVKSIFTQNLLRRLVLLLKAPGMEELHCFLSRSLVFIYSFLSSKVHCFMCISVSVYVFFLTERDLMERVVPC